jgi:hypothetical protein
MFKKFFAQKPIDKEIDRVISYLGMLSPDSENYVTASDNLKALYEGRKNQFRVSPDTIVLAVTNLIGILMIIRQEEFNIVTSKAIGFIIKPKA